jgi:hypothetical protein
LQRRTEIAVKISRRIQVLEEMVNALQAKLMTLCAEKEDSDQQQKIGCPSRQTLVHGG